MLLVDHPHRTQLHPRLRALPGLSVLPRVTGAQQRKQRAVGGHGGVNVMLEQPVPDTEHGHGPAAFGTAVKDQLTIAPFGRARHGWGEPVRVEPPPGTAAAAN